MMVKVEPKEKPKVLTKAEEKLFIAMKEWDTVANAAQEVGIAPKTAYNMLYRLRAKYRKARRFVNFMEAQKRNSDTIRMVMTSRMDLAEKKEIDLEEEED